MARRYSPIKRALLVAIAITFGALAPRVMAEQTKPPGTAGASNRYLFIVETSGSMEKRTNAVYSVLSDLIYSGLKGNLAPGDTIGLWNYNKQLFAGRFPLQPWSQKGSRFIFESMIEYLGSERWQRSANVRPVVAALSEVVKASDNLTVVWISSGEEMIQGTPFDAEINKSFNDWKKEEKKRKMPFVTVLVASHGAFIKNTVAPMPWDVEVPRVPDHAQPVAKSVAKAGVSLSASHSSSSSNIPQVGASVGHNPAQPQVSAPLIMTGSKLPQPEVGVSQVPRETILATTKPIAAALLPTISVQARTLPESAATVPPGAPAGALYFHGPSSEEKHAASPRLDQSAVIASAPTTKTQFITPKAAVVPMETTTNVAATIAPAALAAPNPPPEPRSASVKPDPIHPTTTTQAVVVANPLPVNLLICAFLAALALGAIGAFAILRRSQSQAAASLITKSIELSAAARKA